MIVDQIADNVFLIRGKNNGKFPYSHSVLITCKNGGAALLDTGCGIDFLNEAKAQFDIRYVVNSHTHPDHSAGNWVFGEGKVKAIYVPEEGFQTSGDMKALSERLAEPGPLAELWKEFVVKTMNMKDCRPTNSFSDRMPLELGGTTLIPIHTPGHTVDHYCIYEPEKRILFSFDYDLSPFGPWYGHRESSIPQFKKSIEKLKKVDARILVSGHAEPVKTNIRAQLTEFSAKFNERDEKIISLVRGHGKTISEVVDASPIYGKYPYAELLLRYWEENMIRKHVEDLVRQGRVTQKGDLITS
jgi:glyoxylase-like metal-dependent hydrolase (beta-lactamase superfamily II)